MRCSSHSNTLGFRPKLPDVLIHVVNTTEAEHARHMAAAAAAGPDTAEPSAAPGAHTHGKVPAEGNVEPGKPSTTRPQLRVRGTCWRERAWVKVDHDT